MGSSASKEGGGRGGRSGGGSRSSGGGGGDGSGAKHRLRAVSGRLSEAGGGGGGGSLRALRRVKTRNAVQEDGVRPHRRGREGGKPSEAHQAPVRSGGARQSDAAIPNGGRAGRPAAGDAAGGSTTDGTSVAGKVVGDRGGRGAPPETRPQVFHRPPRDAAGNLSRVGAMTTRIERTEEAAAEILPPLKTTGPRGADGGSDGGGPTSSKLQSLVAVFGDREAAAQEEAAAAAAVAAAKPRRKSSAVMDESGIRSLRTVAPVVVRVPESSGL
ncbi:hypothetical protein MMPV_004486 [Pyropia vietnamensis]